MSLPPWSGPNFSKFFQVHRFATGPVALVISALQKDLLSADLHGKVHARVMPVIGLLEIMAGLYWFSYSDI